MKINLKKTIPILTITILLISTIAFIGIQPANASPGIILETQGTATAEWTTEKAYSGSYSAKLVSGGAWDNAIVKVYYGLPLTDIDNDDIEYWYYTSIAAGINSWSVLYLDTNGNGTADVLLWGRKQAVETRDAWTETTPDDLWQIKTDPDEDGTWDSTITDWDSLANWKAGAHGHEALSDADLLYVGVHWGTATPDQDWVIYIDDFTMDGVTYPLEPKDTLFTTVTPDLVKGDKTYWFDITVRNTISESSIYNVTVEYPFTFKDVTPPSGWSIDSHNTVTKVVVFKAVGPGISPEGSATFKFKMTTTPAPDSTADYDWVITCTDTAQKKFAAALPVTVDVEPPTVTVTELTEVYYSVGAGNYMWLNLTVKDDIKRLPSVYVNDTRFELYETPTATADGGYKYEFCYVNNTAIPDGHLCVWFNVTDYVGNWREGDTIDGGKVSAKVETTVDNTAPFILINVEEGTSVDSVFYIGEDVTNVMINVTVANYGLDSTFTGIYINDTRQTWTFTEKAGKEYKGYPVWECREALATPAAYNLWILNVNATDTALPSNHTSRMEVRISRDLESPYEIGFTSAEAICGGVIIRGLYAKDLVGVMDYNVYVNGTDYTPVTISEANLKGTKWAADTGYGAFNRIAVLDLIAYVGDFVNITVIAEDFGFNPSDEIVLYTGIVPEGEWYPVVLEPKWNLVSLPLIPNSTASADVLSLVLQQGATGVSHVYEYNQLLDSWIIDPAKIEDGKGYWFYMEDYDVLIVSGSKMPPGGGIPPTYTLTEGWVLAGFKSTADMTVDEYLASVRDENHFKIIYIWKAETQSWGILNRDKATHKLTPGQGFWILMYEEEVLVPPTA